MPRVCLNMIVKNETAIIERCLAAAAPHIDCYAICDTGSTDATVEVIRQFFAQRGIPGEISTTTFHNFEQARNEALDAARASSLDFDYILLCDADMELVTLRPGYRDELKAPAYEVIQQAAGGLEYPNRRLIRRGISARYRGVTHEYLDAPSASWRNFDGIRFYDHATGANRANKFERDVALLLEGLKQEPGNPRYVFYLAGSYESLAATQSAAPQAGEWRQKAMDLYRGRSRMAGGNSDEAFYSLLRLGMMKLEDGDGFGILLEAWQRCPHRWEPVHEAVRWLNQRRLFEASYALSKRALASPSVPSGLFVHTAVFDHLLLFEHSISAYWVGQYQESWDNCRTLLGKQMSAPVAEAVRHNMAFAKERLDAPSS